MKTNEIEKILGISKEALRYYEKEGLIKPTRDNNNYRNFNEEDLRLLKVILLLRSLEVSIDEIRLILNNQLPLSQCLKTKKDYIQNDIKNKQDIIDKIDKNLSRKKAYFGYKTIPEEYKNEIYLCFYNDKVIIHDTYKIQLNEYREYLYEQIHQINISLCTRAYNQHISQNNQLQMPEHYLTYGLATLCFIDLDIKTDDNNYQFESHSLNHIKDIFILLKQRNVNIHDPLGLMDIFIQETSEDELRKTLFQHLKNWEKNFGIDNPRSIEVTQQVSNFQENIKKKDIHSHQYVGIIPQKLFYIIVISFICALVFILMIAFIK